MKVSNSSLIAVALDDESSSLEILQQYASKTDFLELRESFTSPSKTLDYLQNHHVDLLFLDVEMPDINGIELAKMVDKKKTKVILVTAFDHYALSAFEVHAIDYLVKPVNYNRFLKACLRAKEAIVSHEDASDFLFVKDGYQLRKLEIKEIKYIKSDANWLNIYTMGDRVITRMTLSRIQETLPPTTFFRVHKSYIVNLRHVDRIDQQFVYTGSEAIPISSSHRSAFQEAVNGFLMN